MNKEYNHMKNDIFLNEGILFNYSLDEVINFCKLDINISTYIYENYFKKNINEISDMLVYIINNDFAFFNQNNFEKENIILEYEKIYNNDKLLENTFCNNNIDFYNTIIVVQKKYKNKTLDINELGNFIIISKDILNNLLIENNKLFDYKYQKIIDDIISYIITSKISFLDIFKNSNDIDKLYFKGKYGTNNLEGIPYELDFIIKSRNVKKIYKKLLNKNHNICEIISYDKIIKAIISMISYFGINSTDKVINHLPKDDSNLYKIIYAFDKIDLSSVVISNNKIIYKQEFINFIIGNNLKEPNSLLNLIYKNQTDLVYKIQKIYEYWDAIMIRYNNQNLKNKYAFIDYIINKNEVILEPDEYLLQDKIINICLDNFKFVKISENKMIYEIRKLYHDIKHQYKKNIPYIKEEYNEYTYEILKANDPNIFTLGSLSDCCFKIGGKAENFMKYCALNENSRILVITKDNNFKAMVPLIKKGNILICNSIESESIDLNFHKEMIKLLMAFSNEILLGSGLEIVILGDYIKDNQTIDSVANISSYKIDEKYEKIFEDYIYPDDENFKEKFYLLKGDINNIDLNYIGNSYNDPREEIINLENNYDGINIEKNKPINLNLINNIYYEKYKDILNINNINKIIYNNDWFIIITNDNQILSECVSQDERGLLEYTEYLSLEKEYIKKH